MTSAYALETVWNPFIGNLDYVVGAGDVNLTDYNLTADYIKINNITSCDSLDTDSQGNIICGIDNTAGEDTVQFYYLNGSRALTGTMDANNQALTDIGMAIMSGLIYSEDIIPSADNLYSIGNSTNWFKNLYAHNIYSDNIETGNLSASNISTDDISSEEMFIEENLTIGSYEVRKKDGDLVVILA